jgi:hypothetical protein
MTKKSTAKANRCKSYTEQSDAISERIKKEEAKNTFDLILATERAEIIARATHDVIHVGLPDFLLTAIVNAIDEAAKAGGKPSPTYANDETETIEQAIEKIDSIFCFARATCYKPADANSLAALATHLSAVANHPLLPVEVHNPLADALADLDSYVDHNSPEYLERALVIYTAEREKEVRDNG